MSRWRSVGVLSVSAVVILIPLVSAQRRLAGASSATVHVSISTTSQIAVDGGFAGYNAMFMTTGLKGTDERLVAFARRLRPGWLRYPGGTRANSFDWSTGLYNPEWISRADTFFGEESRHTSKLLAATGPQKIDDLWSLAANVKAAGLIVNVNVFTDTPASAAQLARYAKEHEIRVLAWQLGAEASQQAFSDTFPTASVYADKVRPFGDAIKLSDPAAKIAVSLGVAREPFIWRRDHDWNHDLAKYRPRYWDVLTYSQFPKIEGSDPELIAKLNEVLLMHTEKYVTEYLVPMFGNVPLIITDADAGSPLPQRPEDAMDAAVIRPGTSMVGTLYGGIWSAEYALRLSSMPQMKHVGLHQLLGPAGIQITNPHKEEILSVSKTGRVIDTAALDYGMFIGATGMAYSVASEAINGSDHACKTVVTGGSMVHLTQGRTMPALYAQAYKTKDTFTVVITNKGSDRELLALAIDGRSVSARLRMFSVTGHGPSARNSLASEAVSSTFSEAAAPVAIPPYSVVRISW